MSKPRLNLSLTTVENNGLLIEERLSPCRQYVFTDPRGFYEWLCQQMGVTSKPDSHTYDGHVVTSGHKLDFYAALRDAAEVYRELHDDKPLFAVLDEFEAWERNRE